MDDRCAGEVRVAESSKGRRSPERQPAWEQHSLHCCLRVGGSFLVEFLDVIHERLLAKVHLDLLAWCLQPN
jgi:hypothetical protein